jgi:hypothetical protein
MALIDCPSDLSENDRVKRILLFVATILVTVSVFFVAPRAHAEDWVTRNFGKDNDTAKLNGTMNKAAYGNDSFNIQIMSLNCAIVPWFGPDNCTNNSQIQGEMLKKSALGNIAMGIGAMYANPPADLAYWIRDTGQTLGFIPRQAYAQGVGFSGLTPLLPLWKAFRNISYLLLALAMIIIGFMVMLRKKIDPKTVVTVQNALPRIVIALILITFSYAIVGLMIDIMYLVIALVVGIMQTNLPETAKAVPINYAGGGLLDLFRAVFQQVIYINPTASLMDKVLTGSWGSINGTDLLSSLFWNLTAGLTGGKTLLLGSLFQLILGIAFLVAFIRILFMLLGCYVQVILGVLTGPLQILTDVFPGSEGFSNWIKNIASNLLVFPITIALLMLGNALGQHLQGGRLWVPPMLLQGADLTGLTEALISLGIVLSIPTIVKSAKEAFKTKPLISFGGGLGGAGGTAMQLMSSAYYLKMLSPSGLWEKLGFSQEKKR